jgi:hypothetical protein
VTFWRWLRCLFWPRSCRLPDPPEREEFLGWLRWQRAESERKRGEHLAAYRREATRSRVGNRLADRERP